MNTTVYPGSPAPEVNSLYCLFYNKICYLDFSKNLSDFERSLLESTVLWELWGCYSNQFYGNEEQVKKHLENIFNKLNRFFLQEKVNHFKKIANDLGLLN